MIKKKYKGRCEKRMLEKVEGVCKTFNPIQYACANYLVACEDIVSIRCNVPMDGLDYTSDFVCTKKDGDLCVRECVSRKYLAKPLTTRLLDVSRNYWLRRGVVDWGIVIEKESRENARN